MTNLYWSVLCPDCSLQLQRGPGDPHHYTSMADCIRKMVKHEGYVL